jgi:hypothetical protein
MYYVCKSYENSKFHLVDNSKPTWELDVKVVDILTFNVVHVVHVVEGFRVLAIGGVLVLAPSDSLFLRSL